MTAIAISCKRKKVAQLNLSYDSPEPTSLSLGKLSVELGNVEESLLTDFAYYLSSFPAGKVFIDLSCLSTESGDNQSITYEDVVVILRAFPEGWTYQATNPPTPAEPDNFGDRVYQQSGAMIY
jgi:hypothetical protein